jgi:hypothetical protein
LSFSKEEMMNTIKRLLATASVVLLAACGGGSDSQALACSGAVLPSYGGAIAPVAGWCVPVATTTTTVQENSLSNCCVAYTGGYNTGGLQRYTVQIGKSDLRGMVCTRDRAFFSCEK